MYRGNRSHKFYKMFVLENFPNFKGMHLRCSYLFLDWQVYNTGPNIWSKRWYLLLNKFGPLLLMSNFCRGGDWALLMRLFWRFMEARKSPVKKTELKKQVKHYDVIVRVNNSKVFYLVNNTKLLTRDDLII